MRKTFKAGDRRLAGVSVCGISWREAFEACLGFLADEDVPDGHFAAADIELLARSARERLHRVEEGNRLRCRVDVRRPGDEATWGTGSGGGRPEGDRLARQETR